MHKLLDLFKERIASGLQRKSITKCSQWAETYRIMGPPFAGKWNFRHHPWLWEMHNSEAEFNVGQKSAQMGFTETALNITFYNIDIKGVNCLYVLPTKTPDAGDFSASRFDAALELCPHLQNMFSDVKNVGHKRAGNANLFVRGSRSRAGLKSIPVAFVVLDEVDEMDQDNIPLALERSAGQVEKAAWAISTPTLPMVGINKLYEESSKEHYFFKCTSCSRHIELTFPDCLEITAEEVTDPRVEESFLKCSACKNKLIHETKPDWLQKAIWVPSYSDRPHRGFQINQLYSSTVAPAKIAKSYLRSLSDPTEEQEFYNSKLGLEHIVAGAGVTEGDLERSRGSHKKGLRSQFITTIGIDVGRVLHYEIDEWRIPGNVNSIDLNVMARCRVIDFGKLQHFEELDELMRSYRIHAGVIDANPERRKAYEFAMRFPRIIYLCFYGVGMQGKQIHVGKDMEPTITVDRTSWLDLSLGRFKSLEPSIKIPIDVNLEYKEHMKSLVRVFERDKLGNPIGRYVKGSGEDHYAHARNYAEIALPFACSFATNQDIESTP